LAGQAARPNEAKPLVGPWVESWALGCDCPSQNISKYLKNISKYLKISQNISKTCGEHKKNVG